jgi:hypothetical protein
VLSDGPAPVRLPDRGDDVDVQSMLAGQQAAIATRLEEGLVAIQRRADKLMRQVGAEVYRASQKARGPSPPLKDEAARSILTYVDERFQTLNLAVGRLEQAVQKLAQATGDVLLRTDQSRETVDRIAAATREYASHNQAAMKELATRVQRAIQPLSVRLDAVEASVKAATTRNRADLTAFTQRVGEGFSRVGQRLREGFAAMQERSRAEQGELVERIQTGVAAEMERLELAVREHAAQSVGAAEQVSRVAFDATARTEAALDMLRERIEDGLAQTAKEARELVEESAARTAERQQEILADAIGRAESGQTVQERLVVLGEPEADVPTAIEDVEEEIDVDLADLRSALADLDDLADQEF